jgi:hypothetical protein
MKKFLDWMVKPCTFYIDQFKPQTPRAAPPSLAEYFAPDTVSIKLTNVEGGLKAIMCLNNTSDAQSFTPRVALSDPTVLAAISQGIPLILATQLKPVLGPKAHEADYDLIPTTVQANGSETRFHFKPAFEKDSFQRELDILLRLRSDAFPADLHVSRLGGLVLNADGVSLLGLLVEHIRGNGTLYDAVDGSGKEERDEWVQQLKATVEQLHHGDVVWGDVNPHNVLLDINDDAWVVNFGGGCADSWIDQELCNTVEGDLQGLANIGGYLWL